PKTDSLVRSGRGQLKAVGTKGQAVNVVTMSLDNTYDVAGRHVPKPNDVVVAAGGQRPPVFAEGDAMDAVLRFLQEDLGLPAFFGEVKHHGRLISLRPASSHALAVGTEDDLQHTSGMSHNHLGVLPGSRVPDANGTIAGSGRQSTAIGAIAHGKNGIRVPLE